MSKFKLRKIAMKLSIPIVFSSIFASNIVGMEKNKPKTKQQAIEMVNTVKEKICDVTKMISENEDIPSIDIKLLEIAKFLVILNEYESKYKLLDRLSAFRLRTMIRYIESIRISFKYSSPNEYKSLFAYMKKHPNVFR